MDADRTSVGFFVKMLMGPLVPLYNNNNSRSNETTLNDPVPRISDTGSFFCFTFWTAFPLFMSTPFQRQ
ncbi:hypothetical protein SAMN04488112_10367 [Melghirimyces thermohalophilus]|uniref:Uncharacterized protein n=1 Tax=Melghirimyces thermohalophilus TaxID=1236220 RepID=A0A1G6IVP4_9BACL|nr:hypothetical protein SAMN04488112_10367 [Melghirimyces thermohalophilus]